MKPETITARFATYLDRLDGITPQTKSLVLRAARDKTDTRQLTGDDNDPIRQEIHFQVIRAEIIKEHWTEISDDERLLLCFPAARKIGESFDIPKRGKGTLLRRRLTERLGMEMTFRMEDGSIFEWEFFD